MAPPLSTKEFLSLLKEKNELLVIEEEVDPYLELAEIQRRVVAKKGPALYFPNVKGSQFGIATNLFGSESRMLLALGTNANQLVKTIAKLAMDLPPTPQKIWKEKETIWKLTKVGIKRTNRSKGPVFAVQKPDLSSLPKFTSWPKDGGPFITLPLVYTQSPQTQKGNLGMYRIQIFDANTTGMHIQIHRGGGFHYYEAEKLGQPLPVHIYVGGPPALTISAVAPLPEGISEFLFTSLLLGRKLELSSHAVSPYPFVSEADFCIVGSIPPNVRKLEGPFGDHYGYYALAHEYPIVNVKNLFHRKDAIWPATVVGRPPQEDHYIAEFLQEVLSPLFPLVMPMVKSVWAYEESGVHSLAGAVVKERYKRESFMGILRVLSEGQLSLTKVVMATDQDVDLKNFRKTFQTVIERWDPKFDTYIFANVSQDTLDYTSGKVNEGSKMAILGVGDPKGVMTTTFSGQFRDNRIHSPIVFVPGVLVLSANPYEGNETLAESILQEESIRDFKLVVLVNDSKDATQSDSDFLWTVFTRMEPARDVYAVSKVDRNHIVRTPPIVWDSRLKPWYPPLTLADPLTKDAVDKKFQQRYKNAL